MSSIIISNLPSIPGKKYILVDNIYTTSVSPLQNQNQNISSNILQSHITKLIQETIDSIKSKARELKGNAVIGLTTTINDIKNFTVVNTMGTVVKFIEFSNDHHKKKSSISISNTSNTITTTHVPNNSNSNSTSSNSKKEKSKKQKKSKKIDTSKKQKKLISIPNNQVSSNNSNLPPKISKQIEKKIAKKELKRTKSKKNKNKK
jgi:hypothetical protein